jgi:hypothetical protein
MRVALERPVALVTALISLALEGVEGVEGVGVGLYFVRNFG